jgi:signal recognition particle subunit SRP54
MLEIVSKGFTAAKNKLAGKTELTAENIEDAVRDVRVALLEADVEINVVKTFIERVKERAIGRVVSTEVDGGKKKLKASPEDHFIAICQEELETLLGATPGTKEAQPIVFRRPVTTIMMVGLQGTGKTTTTGKLASYLLRDKRKPLLVAADIYRPAAVDQLKVLGEQLGVPVFHEPGVKVEDMCAHAVRKARDSGRDVVIFDTAGRLAIDDDLMNELERVKEKTKPDNIFLVVDAMSGQDAVRTAAEFNRRLPLNGFIMTKLDGDARGGAALSIREVTKKPIKFLGMGETLDKLEVFRPEGLASRILGMGDIVGLMKDFEQVVDEKQAERDTKKLLAGKFTLNDFLTQIKTIQSMGSFKDILDKFPLFGGGGMPEGVNVDDKQLVRIEAMIKSMTTKEREEPQKIDKSRATRIAKGSGVKPEDVTDLIGRFNMMQTMMQQIGQSPGLLGQLPGFKQLAQMRNLRNMNMDDVFGQMKGMPKMPGMGGMGGMGMPAGLQEAMAQLPRGFTPPGFQAPRPAGAKPNQQSAKDKKDKRKAQKAARKKSRR